jgi:hypothetical protein
MLVFFMLFVLVPPAPVLPLFFVFQAIVLNVGLMPFFPPLTVGPILAVIPIVVILVIAIVNPTLTLFLLVPLMIVLWRHCPRG